MVKTIQIKNAQKKFKKHFFKMMGHDFLRVFGDVGYKLNSHEMKLFKGLHKSLTEKYGDYEVYVEVLPGKIKVTLLEDFD